MKQEAMELVVTACEKHSANNEVNNTFDFEKKINFMQKFVDGCKNDKRANGQKIWTSISCSSWRRVWIRNLL